MKTLYPNMGLSTIEHCGQLLFDSDIDDEMSNLIKSHSACNASEKTDIEVFGEHGVVTIVLRKSANASMDDHVGDLMEYAHLLAIKSKGKINQFRGYLIGHKLNPNRLFGFKKFTNGKGYFGTKDISYQKSRIGEIYLEVLFCGDVVPHQSKRAVL